MKFSINRCSMEDVDPNDFNNIIQKDDIFYIEINTLDELLKLLYDSYRSAPDYGGLFISKEDNGLKITIRDFYYE